MSIEASNIRIAGKDDFDAVSRVGTASFRAAYEGSCSTTELEGHLAKNFSESIVREQLRNPRVTYLLAVVDRVPAAIAKLRDGATPDAIPSRNAFEIQQFYVSPEHQRIGLGRDLMTAALDVAKNASAEGVWLSVWEKADWAIQFYVSCGFTRVGSADFPMGTTVYHDFLMWRSIMETAGD